ncbi:hypothetical protein HDU93_007682 [Gonapodya sp. JEL0774]|nr:hypothetical protein HDU93_007682 [Gonapodya sp. JEL0774]
MNVLGKVVGGIGPGEVKTECKYPLAERPRPARITLYDSRAHGSGACLRIFRRLGEVIKFAYDVVENCPCTDELGCKDCVVMDMTGDQERSRLAVALGEQMSAIDRFESLVGGIMRNCTPDAIRDAKDWVLERCKTGEHFDALLDFLQVTQEGGGRFESKLFIVYLVNDVLAHSDRRKIPVAKAAILKRAPLLLRTAMFATSEPDKKAKVTKLLDIWESKHYFSESDIRSLRDALTGRDDCPGASIGLVDPRPQVLEAFEQYLPAQAHALPPVVVRSTETKTLLGPSETSLSAPGSKSSLNSLSDATKSTSRTSEQSKLPPADRPAHHLPAGLMVALCSPSRQPYTPLSVPMLRLVAVKGAMDRSKGPADEAAAQEALRKEEEVKTAVEEMYAGLVLQKGAVTKVRADGTGVGLDQMMDGGRKDNNDQTVPKFDGEGWEVGYLDFWYERVRAAREAGLVGTSGAVRGGTGTSGTTTFVPGGGLSGPLNTDDDDDKPYLSEDEVEQRRKGGADGMTVEARDEELTQDPGLVPDLRLPIRGAKEAVGGEPQRKPLDQDLARRRGRRNALGDGRLLVRHPGHAHGRGLTPFHHLGGLRNLPKNQADHRDVVLGHLIQRAGDRGPGQNHPQWIHESGEGARVAAMTGQQAKEV